MTLRLTPGHWHESKQLAPLMETGAVRRNHGRLRLRPGRLVGDKGYSSRANRAYLYRRGIRRTIARRKNEARGGPFSRAIYRERNQVERFINRMKRYRRIATRYEKLGLTYQAMWLIAATLFWL